MNTKIRMNLAPFVDLFSILAIGLLVIMSVSSGTESPIPSKPDYQVVRFYLGRPAALEAVRPGQSLQKLVRLEPYFLVNDKEVERHTLGVTVDVVANPDSVEVMIKGHQQGLRIGFRIAEIVDNEIVGMTFDTTLLLVGSDNEQISQTQTIGSWLDPIIGIGD